MARRENIQCVPITDGTLRDLPEKVRAEGSKILGENFCFFTEDPSKWVVAKKYSVVGKDKLQIYGRLNTCSSSELRRVEDTLKRSVV